MRVFLTKGMVRFARRELITSLNLHEAIARAEKGLIDADLGGGLIKQRSRAVEKDALVFLYGFAKSELENIGHDELVELRKIGSNWLNTTPQKIAKAIEEGILQEIDIDEQEGT